MERIHVAVRSRPLSPEDSRSSPWKISGNAIAHSAQSSSRFEFDRIFGEECRTAEALGRCSLVSRRFHELVPLVDSVLVRVDCVIPDEPPSSSSTPSSPTASVRARGVFSQIARIVLGGIVKPIQALGQILTRQLRLRLSGILRFGSTLGSCVILGASSASPSPSPSSAGSDSASAAPSVDGGHIEPDECDDSGSIPESFYTNGGFKLRVIWSINSLIAAAARHYLLQPIIADHMTLERLDLTDADGTVFAYGQTNSGKTFTMRGSANEPGIIPLAVHDLFQRIQEHMDREFLVRMSYMEIYNEDINDLLVPEHRKLQIHESIEKGIFVAGLREEIVTCAEQVMDFMSFGESHRHIGETNMNLYSSRSHTIFRMVIESREKGDDNEVEDFCDAVRVSVLNLVDLAGSERAAKTGAEGVRLKEGSHINKSLMTLGTVIKKLSEGIESQGGHVPYRDSKLTRILQPALGGNSNTAIICNITLAQIHTDETKSSLQFASRALRVTNCACVNEILTDAALLKRQRKEIEELRAKLRKSESDHWEEEILNLRNTLLQSELEKERISLELEEEKKAKEQRDRCLIEQAKKIENLSSLVLNSDRDDRSTAFSKNKRRVTWCPGPNAKQFDIEDLRPVQEGSTSSTVRNERDMGMPPLFEELMQESNDEPCANVYSSGPGNVSKDSEDVPLPDSHALLHVTNRRKPKAMKKSDQEQFRGRAGELLIPQDPCDGNDALRHKNTVPCVVSSLSSRESEAILVIKQLQDQIKLLEAEKSSVQTNLDAVLVLATQQKVSFNEEYEEVSYVRLRKRKFESIQLGD
ncbi:Kinesin-like protein KIN-7O [Zea mays]|uniref:Kinesin-like protein n=1 Tax=Zea mays TaxID=4577 RepID=A0A1D6I4H8_MAIZE|nr:Kinesin-like protein KIN-7O [Zea mays]